VYYSFLFLLKIEFENIYAVLFLAPVQRVEPVLGVRLPPHIARLSTCCFAVFYFSLSSLALFTLYPAIMGYEILWGVEESGMR